MDITCISKGDLENVIIIDALEKNKKDLMKIKSMRQILKEEDQEKKESACAVETFKKMSDDIQIITAEQPNKIIAS